ncbi:MAG: YceI family protein [Saprospiraceae bacterium]
MQKQKSFLSVCLILLNTIAYSQSYFNLDPGHTLVQFNVERFMVGEVTGVFTKFQGKVTMDEQDHLQDVQVVIAVKSLDSNHEIRDGHLKGAMWLDADNFPEITFQSIETYNKEGQQFLKGNLTIKDITKEVTFPYKKKGPFKDPTGTVAVGFSGDLTINRQDYGINFSKVMDNGALFIGNEVVIKIRALAIVDK